MASVCVDLNKSGNNPPAYCNGQSYKQTDEYKSLCDAHKNALGALYNKIGDNVQGGTDGPNPFFTVKLASCQPVSGDMVEEASNNGLEVMKLRQGWLNSVGGIVPSTNVCTARPGYGVFDSDIGARVTSFNPTTGVTSNATVDSMYDDFFQGCDPTTSVAPYFVRNTETSCPSAKFVPQCQNPNQVGYAACKVPGWDYMKNVDASGLATSRWAYDMSSCTHNTFTGEEYVMGTGNAAGVDCSKQCCVYASATTDSSGQNCNLCAEASSAASTYRQDWSGASTGSAPTMVLENKNGGKISMPYCNAYGRELQSRQGVAISLKNADASPLVAQFGDPAECRAGGKFEGQCVGLTGCDGAWGGVGTRLNFPTNPCGLGFSTTSSNPANNCPNLYTLQNAGADNNCRFTTTQGQGICTPVKFGSLGGNCDTPDENNMVLTSKSTDAGGWGYPRVNKITIPEGAWVTTYNVNSNFSGPTMAPNNVNHAICNPNLYSQDGTDAWTFGCGRDGAGNLVGKSQAVKVMADGSWQSGTTMTGFDGTCSSDPNAPAGTNCVNGSVDTNARTCSFNTGNNAHYGWSMGFMPGYYNSTCQTNDVTRGNGNECGTLPV